MWWTGGVGDLLIFGRVLLSRWQGWAWERTSGVQVGDRNWVRLG